MAEPEQITAGTSVQRFKTRSRQTWHGPTPYMRLQKLPPLVVPEEMPETTMSRIFNPGEYDAMVTYLLAYQRGGDLRRWDEFRNRIPDELLISWGIVMIECKRNGFVNPHVFNGKIIWDQILENGSGERRNADLCTLCDRDCRRREMVDTGDMKRKKLMGIPIHEPKPCWVHDENITS